MREIPKCDLDQLVTNPNISLHSEQFQENKFIISGNPETDRFKTRYMSNVQIIIKQNISLLSPHCVSTSPNMLETYAGPTSITAQQSAGASYLHQNHRRTCKY